MNIKPDTNNSIMISVFKIKDPRNIITDLCKIRVEESEKKARVVLDIDREKLKIEPGFYDLFAVGVTNDPYSEWSLDWGNLGCFKLGLKLDKATVLPDKLLIAECDIKDFDSKLIVPDRRMDRLP